jgi:hypothetical protein
MRLRTAIVDYCVYASCLVKRVYLVLLATICSCLTLLEELGGFDHMPWIPEDQNASDIQEIISETTGTTATLMHCHGSAIDMYGRVFFFLRQSSAVESVSRNPYEQKPLLVCVEECVHILLLKDIFLTNHNSGSAATLIRAMLFSGKRRSSKHLRDGAREFWSNMHKVSGAQDKTPKNAGCVYIEPGSSVEPGANQTTIDSIVLDNLGKDSARDVLSGVAVTVTAVSMTKTCQQSCAEAVRCNIGHTDAFGVPHNWLVGDIALKDPWMIGGARSISSQLRNVCGARRR